MIIVCVIAPGYYNLRWQQQHTGCVPYLIWVPNYGMISRCIWRIFIIWIHTNSNLCSYCGRASIYFPLINVICDMLNRDQNSPTGRGEDYIHILTCFYYFYVNLYEYDVYILWCFICSMYASVWFVPGWARYPSLVGCKARFGAALGNATSFFYIFVS